MDADPVDGGVLGSPPAFHPCSGGSRSPREVTGPRTWSATGSNGSTTAVTGSGHQSNGAPVRFSSVRTRLGCGPARSWADRASQTGRKRATTPRSGVKAE